MSETAVATCAALCLGEFHEKGCPVAKILRDTYCTPEWLTDRLPLVDLDPCSNPRSTVKAKRHLSLEAGDDGLAFDWRGKSVFCNPPFSDVMPWARKAIDARAFIFLVNEDSSVKWWRELVNNGGRYIFKFYRRVEYDPPPRIQVSRNNKPSVLVCNWEGALMCGDHLTDLGQWWSAGRVNVEQLLDSALVGG